MQKIRAVGDALDERIRIRLLDKSDDETLLLLTCVRLVDDESCNDQRTDLFTEQVHD